MIQRPFRSAGGSRGFTLIEAMVTVSVMAILATIAAPSFMSYLANSRLEASAYSLHSAILLARSESIKRNATVVLATKDVSGNWANGWRIYPANRSTAYILDSNGSDGITISNDKGASQIAFTSDGRPSMDVIFTISTTSSASGVNPICVSITLSGYANVQKSTSSTCP